MCLEIFFTPKLNELTMSKAGEHVAVCDRSST